MENPQDTCLSVVHKILKQVIIQRRARNDFTIGGGPWKNSMKTTVRPAAAGVEAQEGLAQ